MNALTPQSGAILTGLFGCLLFNPYLSLSGGGRRQEGGVAIVIKHRELENLVQGSCRLPCFTVSEGVLNRPQEQPGEADNAWRTLQCLRTARRQVSTWLR